MIAYKPSTHDDIHFSQDGKKTLCGVETNAAWLILPHKYDRAAVTCQACKDALTAKEKQ